MKWILILSIFASTLLWAQDNRLTLHAYKSSVGVDWRSPKDLAISVVKNEIYRYFNGNQRLLGHVSIELLCGDRKVVTGMVGQKNENRRMVLQEDAGYGVLFHIFQGALEEEEKLNLEVSKKRKDGFVHSATYLVNDESCQKMLQHYDNYVAQGGAHNYGFPLNTLEGEGGGCSAFGVSFLQVAQVAVPEHLKQWSGSVWVPNKLIGHHNTKRYTSHDQTPYTPSSETKKVSLLSILFDDEIKAWSKPNDPDSRYLEYFDPDTMFRWIQNLAELPQGDSYTVKKHDQSYEIIFDQRSSSASLSTQERNQRSTSISPKQ